MSIRCKKAWCAAAGIMLAAVAILGVYESVSAHGRGARWRYRVTVTNLTRGQILSPTVVATHNSRMMPIFMMGAPASDALAAIAEDAISDPIVGRLEASPNVKDVAMIFGENGPILPGESASVMVDADPRFSKVSAVGMLVTTNDGFYAVNRVQGPRYGSSTFFSPAYDAGTEANNELCSHIPGPPCGNAEVRDTEGAEGFVHVHAGIHGVGDLDPAMHDWRNPVAKITVTRVRVSRDRDEDRDRDK